jgi:predicted RNA methylase
MKYNYLREATESLLDEERIRAFQKAITRTVRLGESVLDCGAGTGILSILAAKEGAIVVAIEKDKSTYEMVKNNLKSSSFQPNVSLLNCDAAAYKGGPVNVVIMDMLDTMLIGKDQVRVTNALCSKKIITSRTKVIPLRVSNFIEPVTYDFEFCESHMPMIIQSRDLRINDRCVEVLGSSVLYSEVRLNDKIIPKCVYEGRHLIHTKGWLNALKFSTVGHLTEDLILGSTGNWLTPVYVPVHEMVVKPGEVVRIHIEYQMSGGYDTLKVNVT